MAAPIYQISITMNSETSDTPQYVTYPKPLTYNSGAQLYLFTSNLIQNIISLSIYSLFIKNCLLETSNKLEYLLRMDNALIHFYPYLLLLLTLPTLPRIKVQHRMLFCPLPQRVRRAHTSDQVRQQLRTQSECTSKGVPSSLGYLSMAVVPGSRQNAFWAVGMDMIRKEGLISMGSGFSASMAREVFYSGFRLGAYEFFKDKFVFASSFACVKH